MRSLRNTFWYPLVSLLLIAVLVPVQAAGCCKLATVLGFSTSIASKSVPAAAKDADPGMAADHSCCPKPAKAAVPDNSEAGSAAPCDKGDKGDKACCIKGAKASAPALVSTEGLSLSFSAPVLAWLTEEILPVAAALPARLPPEDSGPPLYLSHLSLLL